MMLLKPPTLLWSGKSVFLVAGVFLLRVRGALFFVAAGAGAHVAFCCGCGGGRFFCCGCGGGFFCCFLHIGK